MSTPLAIVTGASSGIGLETSRLLVGEGWRVLMVARRAEPLGAAARSIGAAALAFAGDVSDPACLDALTARAGGIGPVRALVNNAGAAVAKPVPKTDDATIRDVFGVNALAPAMLTARVWPLLVRSGGGCIVNLSSMASVDPFPGFFAYAAAKAGVNLMARVADDEGRRVGIRAFAVAPGAVETPMLRGMFAESALPRSRTLHPEVVAGVICACIRGEHDAQRGRVIQIPSP
ncbi:MAG: SDR family oxidoreductase [Phycisphaerales bacterium]|nr:SDR family oxidoreductase [Phycisphaerales bacterium]